MMPFPGFGNIKGSFQGNKMVMEIPPSDIARAIMQGTSNTFKKYMNAEALENGIQVSIKLGEMIKDQLGDVMVEPDVTKITIPIDLIIKTFEDKFSNAKVTWDGKVLRVETEFQPVPGAFSNKS